MLLPFNAIQRLAEVSSCQETGCLTVTTDQATWQVFLGIGELLYAETSVQSISQLQYFFIKNGWAEALSGLKVMPKPEPVGEGEGAEIAPPSPKFEYVIAWLQEQGYLNEGQILELIKQISHDSIESLLWVTEAQSDWSNDFTLPSWVRISTEEAQILDLSDIVRVSQVRLRNWQSCDSSFVSPHQRPYLLDFRDVRKPVPNGAFNAEALSKLSELMRRGLSIRQLSLYLKQDELTVAKLLSPYVQNKVIFLRTPQPPFDQLPTIPRYARVATPKPAPAVHQKQKIVCIDDSVTVLAEMRRFLPDNQFEVTTINDPVEASTVIFRLKPDLILLDITMPRINGYRLCSLLRSSSAFDTTPIIMVSGNTGLIDKARAKLSGATDYLTKPFTQEGLLQIIDQHLNAPEQALSHEG